MHRSVIQAGVRLEIAVKQFPRGGGSVRKSYDTCFIAILVQGLREQLNLRALSSPVTSLEDNEQASLD